MRTGTISGKNAHKLAVKVGKLIIDKGEVSGGKVTLEEVQDIFKHSIPGRFRPTITADEREFHEFCGQYGVSSEQAESIKKFMSAISLPKQNARGYFIYVSKYGLEQQSAQLGSDIGHELFHTLSKGKTIEGKEEFKNLRNKLRKKFKLEPGTNASGFCMKVQSLLIDAFKLDALVDQSPEAVKLYGRLRTENRCFAYVRTVLRTVFDPRLKQGEQKVISESHLPIEKKINPASVVVRPTKEALELLQETLLEEAKAYHISTVLDRYGYKLPPEAMPLKQIIAVNFKRASEVLSGEKKY